MTTRTDRLRKLMTVQEKLKSLHETRHAGFVANAVTARDEASEIATRVEAEGSLASIFPDLYNRAISAALDSEAASLKLAAHEVEQVATATMRGNMVEKAYRVAARKDERDGEDRERLELAQRKAQVDRK